MYYYAYIGINRLRDVAAPPFVAHSRAWYQGILSIETHRRRN